MYTFVFLLDVRMAFSVVLILFKRLNLRILLFALSLYYV